MSAPEKFVIQGAAWNARDYHDQALVIIDEETKSFSAISSYGTYVHQWVNIGPYTLKEFLLGVNFDYFAEKTFQGNWKLFDADATCKKLRETVFEAEKEGTIPPQLRELAIIEMTEIEDITDETLMMAKISECEGLNKVLGDDWVHDWEGLRVMKTNSLCERFWIRLWPLITQEFAKTLRDEAVRLRTQVNAEVPHVLVTNSGGIAEVMAVSGAVDIQIIDFNREGDPLTPEQVEQLVLSSEYHTGTKDDMKAALDRCRKDLQKFVITEPAPEDDSAPGLN